ncbi:hypothetical protein OUZ56_013425 [Daphnia magna]|uniref:Uncharacterized protein n=1 Tax=Daphnia magna TaxID=35525 RepID=A0ABQ9Z5V2_9CRUS|nr:hypothetical protein OUZ56_013425 [Daphnia magna]
MSLSASKANHLFFLWREGGRTISTLSNELKQKTEVRKMKLYTHDDDVAAVFGASIVFLSALSFPTSCHDPLRYDCGLVAMQITARKINSE